MSWIKNIFTQSKKEKSINTLKTEYVDGNSGFQLGKKIVDDIRISGGTSAEREVKLKKAVNYFDKAIAVGFDESAVYSYRGGCLRDLGFPFKALEDYTIAIHKKPKQAIAFNFFERAEIRELLNDFKGCIDDYLEAILRSKIENSDNDFWNKHMRGAFYFTATEFYEEHLVDFLLKKGNEKYNIGDYKSACSEYANALETYPSLKIHYKCGEVNLELKDYKNAIHHFTSAINSFPSDPEWLSYGMSKNIYLVISLFQFRAEAYQALGYINEAIFDFTESNKLGDTVYEHSVKYSYDTSAVRTFSLDENLISIICDGNKWEYLSIGFSKENIDVLLSENGVITSKYDNCYFVDYKKYGIQINYNSFTNLAKAIFIFNGVEEGSEIHNSKGCPIKIKNCLDWASSEEDVEREFGTSIEQYKSYDNSKPFRRIVYAGITFKFINYQLTAISIN